MTKDEALTLALDAFLRIESCECIRAQEKAITAIKQALENHVEDKLEMVEQPVEPVAWMDMDGDLYKILPSDNWNPPHTPLYAYPPQQERNFCQRCGKRLGINDWDVHTCTPPLGKE